MHAVNETSEVWLLAVIALVESCALQSVAKLVTVIGVAWVVDTSFFENSLALSLLDSVFLDFGLQLGQGNQLFSDRLAVEVVDWG